jgi:uroporphyrinogen-III synthase
MEVTPGHNATLSPDIQQVSVCIGSTSARACEAAGLKKIYFPSSPGVEGWASSVMDAIKENGLVGAASR